MSLCKCSTSRLIIVMKLTASGSTNLSSGELINATLNLYQCCYKIQ